MTNHDELHVTYQPVEDGTEMDITFRGVIHRSMIRHQTTKTDNPSSDWWKSYITGGKATSSDGGNHRVALVDLFSGSGGLSQGVKLACDALGVELEPLLAVDVDQAALGAYARNHFPHQVVHDSVKNLISYSVIKTGGGFKFGLRPRLVDPDLLPNTQIPTIVIGGPPCQGHSSLNNHTRHNDVRNELYITVPAIAIAIDADMVIIENVPRVGVSKENVVGASIQLLEEAGYQVQFGVLAADALGWPQTRKRFFIVAMKSDSPIPLSQIQAALAHPTRDLRWLIGDIETLDDGTVMTSVPILSELNQARVRSLHDIPDDAEGSDRYRLVDELRPQAHIDSPTYKDVYGKLLWDGPAQTLTTGFLTPGRGRYVHPSQHRTLNPREAARIQGFPDNYVFRNGDVDPGRTLLTKWIGDAVPSPLGFAAALSLLLPFASDA
jgi:DNA (cytosine-5)-methyltransferase 1